MNPATLELHRAVQSIAKSVLHDLGPTILRADSERTIAQRAARMLADRGAPDTWYHSCAAFVLLGSRSGLSISGKDYVPNDEKVGTFNLVTVDLSPERDGIWGDCARSFFIEGGQCVEHCANPIFLRGAEVERNLHQAMRRFVTPTTSFESLFQFANDEIERHGFENLDFLGNVGHSIESHLGARSYIENGNVQTLGQAGLFTFEPHIRQIGSEWGFKHENIYYFGEDGLVREL